MTDQEFNKKWNDRKLSYIRQLSRKDLDVIQKANIRIKTNIISDIFADIKKLNEAIVSEAEFCVVCDEKISTHPVCIHCLVENKFNDKQN